jgi:hypothetical protein
MGQKIAFATTNWKNRPGKPDGKTQAEWDAEGSSCFNGFPFAIVKSSDSFPVELWDGAVEPIQIDDEDGEPFSPGEIYRNSFPARIQQNPDATLVGDGTDYNLIIEGTGEEAIANLFEIVWKIKSYQMESGFSFSASQIDGYQYFGGKVDASVTFTASDTSLLPIDSTNGDQIYLPNLSDEEGSYNKDTGLFLRIGVNFPEDSSDLEPPTNYVIELTPSTDVSLGSGRRSASFLAESENSMLGLGKISFNQNGWSGYVDGMYDSGVSEFGHVTAGVSYNNRLVTLFNDRKTYVGDEGVGSVQKTVPKVIEHEGKLYCNIGSFEFSYRPPYVLGEFNPTPMVFGQIPIAFELLFDFLAYGYYRYSPYIFITPDQGIKQNFDYYPLEEYADSEMGRPGFNLKYFGELPVRYLNKTGKVLATCKLWVYGQWLNYGLPSGAGEAGDISFNFNVPVVNLQAFEYNEYANSDGQPIWDKTTGAMLRDPITGQTV